MNVEDVVRTGLRDAADQVAAIPYLSDTAIARGRRRRATRRAATAGGIVVSIAAITATGFVVANNAGGSGHHGFGPASHNVGTQHVIADPWWQTWTPGRHDGPVDPRFAEALGRSAVVYAAGTTPDGTDWAMYTYPQDGSGGHRVAWQQGWDGQPDFGDVPDEFEPGMTWASWSTPTRSAHDNTSGNQQWLIVVGRPGTTAVDYSADGVTWQPLDVVQGIAVMKVTTATGFPPASARIRLSDASGVYATGKPAVAGAGCLVYSTDGSCRSAPTPSPGTESATAAPELGTAPGRRAG